MKAIYIIVVSMTMFLCCAIVIDVISQDVQQAISVNVETPRQVSIVSEKSYSGHLQPRAEVKVYANITGKIVELNAEAGQTVKKGDVLAQSSASQVSIDAIKAEVALSVAKSQLTTTEANAQTRKRVLKRNWLLRKKQLQMPKQNLKRLNRSLKCVYGTSLYRLNLHSKQQKQTLNVQ